MSEGVAILLVVVVVALFNGYIEARIEDKESK